MEFEFTLTLTLAADDSDVDDFIERPGAAGCTTRWLVSAKPAALL